MGHSAIFEWNTEFAHIYATIQLLYRPGFLNWGPRPPLGTTERFSGGHEQRPLLNSSAMILQNLIDERETTSVESLEGGHKP